MRALRGLGLWVIVLTGDNERTVKTVADTLGITEFQAGVRPKPANFSVTTGRGSSGRDTLGRKLGTTEPGLS